MEGDRKWWTLGAVCIAIFMLLLDITVVNVAIPDIQKDLGASFTDTQWVVDAYALTLAALLLTAGSLADIFGRRLVFTIGLGLFITASLICGLSTSPLMLDLARGAQGIGGAVMFACSLALIAEAFHGRERGTAFGVFGAVTGAAVAIGPLVGGALTQGINWRWIFFVNVPIGIVAMVVSVLRVRESRDEDAGGIDVPGVVTWSGALFLLVFALVRGNAEGWGSALIVGFFAGAAALLAAFVAIERRTASPMFDLTLLRNRSFGGAALVAFTLSASAFAMFLYLTFYIQNVLGYSPLQAGLRFLPATLLSFFVAPISGRLSAKLPMRSLLGAGLILTGVGLLLMTGVDARSDWTVLLPGFVVQGAGIGMVNPPLASTQVGVVPPQRSGMASGIGNTFRQVGIATGIAALGAIFQHLVTVKTAAALPAQARPMVDRFSGALSSGELHAILPHVPAARRALVAAAIRTGFTGALSEILIIAGAISLVGAVAGLALVRSRDFAAASPQAAPAPA